MIVNLHTQRLQSIEEIRAFLEGTTALGRVVGSSGWNAVDWEWLPLLAAGHQWAHNAAYIMGNVIEVCLYY